MKSASAPMTAAVLGCGVIGSSWVEAFLAGGCNVTVWDPSSSAVAAVLDRHLGLISAADTPDAAVSGADFVQESGPETLSAKRELLARISGQVGEWTVVASSTSTLQPSDLQQEHGRAHPAPVAGPARLRASALGCA